jgi:NADH-quinone oxidoreductase subunit N
MDLIVLKSFFPEIFLSLCILFQLVFNSYLITDLKYNFPIIDKEIFWQTIFFLFCLLLLFDNSKIEGFFSNFLFSNDSGSQYVKILFVFSCLAILLILIRSFKLQKLNFFEYFTIFLLSVLSLLLLISSCDMISAYLVIEMQALSFYILASFRRNSAFSTEAGLKYFISGSFISGLFLFGCSLIYGILGTLNFNNLSLLFSIPFDNNFSTMYYFLLIGILLVTITFLFKISAAPFHFWSPDVYEGAPLASTVIFSILPKFAILNFFIKWLSIVSDVFSEVQDLLLFCGILSVLIGTFFAIRQKRLKRLVIYSSIAQVGFIVAALSVNTLNSLVSVYFFLFIYIITSILIWTHFALFYSFQEKISGFYKKAQVPLFISSLSNFFKINKLWAFSFILIFFSIAGIPPLSGFLSKIFILFGLIESNNLLGSLLLILISAISVFYYLRIIKVIFFESKEIKTNNEQFQIIFSNPFFNLDCLLISICLFLLFFFFFYPSYILLICHYIVLGSSFF